MDGGEEEEEEEKEGALEGEEGKGKKQRFHLQLMPP